MPIINHLPMLYLSLIKLQLSKSPRPPAQLQTIQFTAVECFQPPFQPHSPLIQPIQTR